MIVSLESTDATAPVAGAPTRLWKGTTGDGHPVTAYIAAVTSPTAAGDAALAAELSPTPDPSTPAQRWMAEAAALGADAAQVLQWAGAMIVSVIISAEEDEEERIALARAMGEELVSVTHQMRRRPGAPS